MTDISYRGHRFPPIVIQHAVSSYLRFTLSYRDVEELLAERGLEVSYETVRRWVLKFGPIIARRLRRSRPRPSTRWHLDEMVVRIASKHMYLWRAVDHKARFSKSLFSADGTNAQPSSSCASCSASKASRRRRIGWSSMRIPAMPARMHSRTMRRTAMMPP
jgi:transposase-like protein